MACITASAAGVRPSRASFAGGSRVARSARAVRPRVHRGAFVASASATSVSPSPAAPSASLAMAAVVAGSHARALRIADEGTSVDAPDTSAFAKVGSWARAQAKIGRGMVEEMDLASSALFVVSAAMSYKEKKMVALITQAVGSFIKLYLLLLFVRVLLTWFPNVDWMRQPWAILRQVTDPYLNLFRNLIPPIMGQIDFTPILGFMVLQFLAKVLSSDPSVGRF